MEMLMFIMNLKEGIFVPHILEINFSISFPKTHFLSHIHYKIAFFNVYSRNAVWDTDSIISHRADPQCILGKKDLKGKKKKESHKVLFFTKFSVPSYTKSIAQELKTHLGEIPWQVCDTLFQTDCLMS